MKQTPVDSAATESDKAAKERRLKAIIGVSAAVVVLLVAGFFVWRSFQKPESTEQTATTAGMSTDNSTLAVSSWTTPPADAAATAPASADASTSADTSDTIASADAALPADDTASPVTPDRMKGSAPSATAVKTSTANATVVKTPTPNSSNSNSNTNTSKTTVTYPHTTASIKPSSPNGANGWYHTRPVITLSPTNRTTWYRWKASGSWSTYHSSLSVPDGRHTFQYYSREPNGVIESKSSLAVAVDRSGPSQPTNLHVVSNKVGSLQLAWSASKDSLSGVSNYEVFKKAGTGGTLIATPGSASVQLSVTPGTTYTFYVRAVDRAGNKSAYTGTLTVLVVSPPTTTMVSNPTAPDGSNGWFKTAPMIYLTSSQSGVTYYAWDGPATYLIYPSYLIAKEGTQTLSYYSVNDGGLSEAVKLCRVQGR